MELCRKRALRHGREWRSSVPGLGEASVPRGPEPHSPRRPGSCWGGPGPGRGADDCARRLGPPARAPPWQRGRPFLLSRWKTGRQGHSTVSPCCKGHRNPWGPVGPPPAAASPQTPWVSDPAGPRLCSPGPRPWRGTDPRPGLQAALRPGLAHLSSLRPGRWPEAWPARHV